EDGIRDGHVTGVQTCALPIYTFFPSSKLCCVCRQKNAERKLQDRWKCPNPECQTEHQRDENAVVNIFVEGLRILAEGRSVSACGGTARLGGRTQACACEAGNIVGDEQQCCLVTPKNPRL